MIIGFGCLLPRLARGSWSTTRAVQCRGTIINAFWFSLQAGDQFCAFFLLNGTSKTADCILLRVTWPCKPKNMDCFGGIFNLTLDIDNLMFNLSTPGSSRIFWPRALGTDCRGPQDVHDSDFLGGRCCNLFSLCLRLFTLQQSANRLPCPLGSSREISTPLAYCQRVLQLDLEVSIYVLNFWPQRIVFPNFQNCSYFFSILIHGYHSRIVVLLH